MGKKSFQADQLIPTSSTPPPDAGFYRIDRHTIGVVGNMVFRDPSTQAVTNVGMGSMNGSNNIAFIGDSLAAGYYYEWSLAVSSPSAIPTSGLYINFRGGESSTTTGGSGSFEVDSVARQMRWTSPGDTPGPWTVITQGKFTLQSGTTNKGLFLYVWAVPTASATVTITFAGFLNYNESHHLVSKGSLPSWVSSRFSSANEVFWLGTGGAKSSDVLGLLPYYNSVTTGPGFDVVAVGTNSVANAIAGIVIAQEIIDLVTGRLQIGRKVVVVGIPARYVSGSTPMSAGMLTELLTANDLVRAWCSTNSGTRFVDAYSATVASSYTDGRPETNYLSDEVHFAALAVQKVGALVVDALISLGVCDSVSFPESQGWIDFSTRGRMLGTGGTAGTRTTSVGGIPTGWTSSNTANVNSTMEVEIFADHNRRCVDVQYASSGGSGQYARLFISSITLATLGLAVGDTIECYAQMQVVSAGVGDNSYAQFLLIGASDGMQLSVGNVVGNHMLRSPPRKIPAGTTAIQLMLYCAPANAVSSGRVKFGDILCRKLT